MAREKNNRINVATVDNRPEAQQVFCPVIEEPPNTQKKFRA